MEWGVPAGECGPGGVAQGWCLAEVDGLAPVVKTVLEAALEAELVEHLGYSKHDPAGRDPGSNSRNGSRSKAVATGFGTIRINVPRDRWGTFQPVTVGKRQRRPAGLDQLVLALAAKGALREESVDLLSGVYRGVPRRALLGEIASTVRTRMAPWHQRPLSPRFAVVRFQREVLRSRDGRVSSPPIHIVLGQPPCGRPELLGLWRARRQTRAELWREIGMDLEVRGVVDVGEIVCQAMPGLEDDLISIWPQVKVR